MVMGLYMVDNQRNILFPDTPRQTYCSFIKVVHYYLAFIVLKITFLIVGVNA